ncbi:hypothetical protein ACFE04_006717 [Oxalis oulophora]
MKKLRWVTDGELWDLDMSTSRTMEGSARGVQLGLSRGSRLSRPKQIDFMQRFMAAPFLPSFSPLNGFSLHRVLSLPFTDNCFASLLAQFNLNQFISQLKRKHHSSVKFIDTLKEQLRDKTLYAFGLSSELLFTPDDNLFLSFDAYGHPHSQPRSKAVFNHKFARDNLTVETISPGLFVDNDGVYWDVPLSTSVDLASVPSDYGPSYHLSMHHNVGEPQLFQGDETRISGVEAPPTLLPGLFFTGAFAYKQNLSIWRGKGQKLKIVQPYDIFLSNPQISASGTIGAIATASHGDNSSKLVVKDDSNGFGGINLHSPAIKSSLVADMFGSLSFTAQYGNFQKLFLDLTRFQARMDFPHGSKFLYGATCLARDYFNSQQPSLESLQAICPNTTISIQQQIAGPFSFRVDSGVVIDLKNKSCPVHIREPVLAMEYALQVLGSAKAVAWKGADSLALQPDEETEVSHETNESSMSKDCFEGDTNCLDEMQLIEQNVD